MRKSIYALALATGLTSLTASGETCRWHLKKLTGFARFIQLRRVTVARLPSNHHVVCGAATIIR